MSYKKRDLKIRSDNQERKGYSLNIFTEKLQNVTQSVVPVTLIVILFNFTITPLGWPLFFRFILGAFFIVIGLTVFLIGVDLGISPLGSLTGSSLAKSNKLWIVIIAGLVLGFVISIAEPGLIVLANQVELVTSGQVSSFILLIVVSLGMAIMLAFGFLRILYNIPLYKFLTVLYGITFMLAFFSSSEFLAISFDASGSTTGVLAVPFILSLAVGVSHLKKDSKSSEEDSFGLVAITSVGAILSVLFMGFFARGGDFYDEVFFSLSETTGVLRPLVHSMAIGIKESLLVLIPLLLVLLFLQFVSLKMERKPFVRIVKGFIYTFIGLFFFLVGVNLSFIEVGGTLGFDLSQMNHPWLVIIVGFFLGITTILAEPAVYVLTSQIEEVTAGYVKRKAVLLAITIGVGLAVALSMLRILTPGIQLWNYLLPGYIISILLMYTVPKIFVGIAFDTGGVATGPITTTFILGFTQGVAEGVEGANVLVDGFGMIAMVAMLPIITMQLLGIAFKIKSKKGGLLTHEVSKMQGV